MASDEEISMQGANMTLSPDNAHRPIVSDINLALIVYILFDYGLLSAIDAASLFNLASFADLVVHTPNESFARAKP